MPIPVWSTLCRLAHIILITLFGRILIHLTSEEATREVKWLTQSFKLSSRARMGLWQLGLQSFLDSTLPPLDSLCDAYWSTWSPVKMHIDLPEGLLSSYKVKAHASLISQASVKQLCSPNIDFSSWWPTSMKKKNNVNLLKMSLMDPSISIFCEECNFRIDPHLHEWHLNLEMWMHCLDLEGNRDKIEMKLHLRLVTKNVFLSFSFQEKV